MPFGDDNNSLGRPVLLIAIVFCLEQNAKTASTIGAVEGGAESIGEFVLYFSAVGF